MINVILYKNDTNIDILLYFIDLPFVLKGFYGFVIQKGHTEGNSVCCKNKQSNISLEYIIKCRIMLFSNEGSFQGCERGKKKSKRGSKNIE